MGEGGHWLPFFMYLYKQYCYSTVQAAMDSIQSQTTFIGYPIVTVASIGGQDVRVRYDVNGVIENTVLTLPACTQAGFDNSYTGITPAESVELGWLMAAAIIAAWSVKVTRRGL